VRVLVVDASQIQAAVCVLSGERILSSREGSINVSHSEALLPLIHAALDEAKVKPAELDGFAVGVGPGSFTGIRVGCATVKGLAQVLSKPILAFSSLRALALSAENESIAMANAYQGQVFVGWSKDGLWSEDAMEASTWCRQQFDQSSVKKDSAGGVGALRFCGTGAKVYWSQIQSVLPNAVLDAALYATPKGIAAAAVEVLKTKGKEAAFAPYAQLSANYLRPSQAEIKLGAVK
jgi:tRNA threonylcarbamoyladenosine biosynthesis protein TsaB